MDDADGFTAKALQTKDNSLYASNFGASVGRYYGYALSSAGTSYGSAKVGEVGGVNANLVSNENSNSPFGVKTNLASNTNANSDSGLNFYAQSNAEFSNLDKEKGANNKLVVEGAKFVANIAKKAIAAGATYFSKKQIIKKAKLLPTQNGGYIDKFGNVWKKGPSRTKGQDFEWDVQLSDTGRTKIGWATRDGSHANVDLNGRITHK